MSSTPLIQLKNLTKEYRLGEQTLKVLHEVNFALHEGEFVSIVGASGSGKSTLMHIASLLDAPSSGEVYFAGTETSQYSEAKRAEIRNKEIGFVFQQFHLLPKTSAVDNVALPLVYAGINNTKRKELAEQVLDKVGLGDRYYNTPAQLSGGQQQRVAIARALVNNPKILFADEPTGNLDSKSGEEVEQLLHQVHQEGRTVVMVTHDLRLAKTAQRLVRIRDGRITN